MSDAVERRGALSYPNELKPITRREFLQFGWNGLKLAAFWQLMNEFPAIALDSPDRVAEALIGYPMGGWAETSLPQRPDFIHWTSGHAPYLRYMVLEQPVIRDAMTHACNNFFSPEAPRYPLMGDFLNMHIGYAKEALRRNHPAVAPSAENAFHVATFTMAAQCSHYLTKL